ncbi:PREDICTED: uncharacterized protein LOC109233736 [Nicotiana attenuata]|uniref:uncharacterized protein LOC109233736 n=1 Tax=Nicotiana attenuata TaxID=49451 RepID=UPI0009047616|nr:PREDICTED: uncharacterized protein LOC109233736 [Nicotiana attenuata]
MKEHKLVTVFLNTLDKSGVNHGKPVNKMLHSTKSVHLCPCVLVRLLESEEVEKKGEEIQGLRVVPSTEYLHTVNDGGRNYTICLLERKCVCGRFQVDELPCPHAWAVLKSKFLMPEEYCSNYYKPNTIVMTYDVPVYPLPDRNDWNIPEHVAEEVVLPPKWKRPPRRPKKKRNKTLSELLQPKNQHSCSICGQGEHNKRTCRNAPRNK